MSRVSGLISRLASRQVASTVTVQRNTEAVDAGGSVTSAWAQHLGGVTAAVQIRSGSEAIRYGRESNRAFGTVYVDPGQDITAGDRMLFNGRTFDIQNVRTPDELGSGRSMAYMILEVEETD